MISSAEVIAIPCMERDEAYNRKVAKQQAKEPTALERNAGNNASALEASLRRSLKANPRANEILIMGHRDCGGVGYASDTLTGRMAEITSSATVPEIIWQRLVRQFRFIDTSVIADKRSLEEKNLELQVLAVQRMFGSELKRRGITVSHRLEDVQRHGHPERTEVLVTRPSMYTPQDLMVAAGTKVGLTYTVEVWNALEAAHDLLLATTPKPKEKPAGKPEAIGLGAARVVFLALNKQDHSQMQAEAATLVEQGLIHKGTEVTIIKQDPRLLEARRF